MYEWITLNVLPSSIDRLAWQDPPPCVVNPSTIKFWEDPADHIATELPARVPRSVR